MRYTFLFSFLISLQSFAQKPSVNASKQLDYCVAQLKKAVPEQTDYAREPRRIPAGQKNWNTVAVTDWTSGFWPGTLWYAYEYAKDPFLKAKAEGFTESLATVLNKPVVDHDLGFQFYCSYGNGYRLTKSPAYKKILLRAADSLATLFNPKVGTILSWPRPVPNMEWPQHNTIMDNMINLELLFWASKNGGSKKLYDIAVSHATTTMKNHFRPDWTSYHVVVYDKQTGRKIKGVTHQGYADNSMWARGQAWAIYGFTMSYRESGRNEFLETAQKTADVFIKNLPADHVPYWDFNAPDIPDAPRDASAAAVVSSALLELSTLVKDKALQVKYRAEAEAMLASLSSDTYQSHAVNNAFLLHSTGHKPNNSEIDVSINYADYYYIEALLRLNKLQEAEK
ncbi:glycoside hydrolase family 88 protein [Spirosoma endophyticum]|uniref:Unsaturated chondroitin disaccharide hydrolase n=1 Tax=Spirosoma endophyticum TaxID=662367 RepID=A0A1I1L5Y2_9BACT|nr:glycoside hydrolase family 88 protein [Spirosoma endophyticum]SFC66408.1 unsaturated chondroitin disaccharide hydrolase [Spirosoma endophyticum]